MITSKRLRDIAGKYAELKIAVVGDYCLDRYLEINPERAEVSIETGLPVHNVERVRAQPGAAGTVLNNLVALGVGRIYPVGFCGDDGEGYELQRALKALSGVELTHFFRSAERRTFTYAKPLLITKGSPPRELSRIDTKNWSPTPQLLSTRLANSLVELMGKSDAVIVMDQVDLENTGTVTAHVLETLRSHGHKGLVIADSRRGLGDYPPCLFKMNSSELGRLFGHPDVLDEARIRSFAGQLAQRNQYPAVVTMAESGMLGANPDGTIFTMPALPLRGPIDIVGAGDAVTANLAAALAAGASLEEALAMAALAASVVIHQVGTSGSASISEIEALVGCP